MTAEVDAVRGAIGSLLLIGGGVLIVTVVGTVIGRLLRNSADRATALCRCSHAFNAHEHDHPRTYCGMCDCTAYRAAVLPVRVSGRCRHCSKAWDDCPDPILHASRR